MTWLTTITKRCVIIMYIYVNLNESFFKCIARESHVASHWYDYGVFCLLIRDLDKSEQCFKEAVSLDQKFVPA